MDRRMDRTLDRTKDRSVDRSMTGTVDRTKDNMFNVIRDVVTEVWTWLVSMKPAWVALKRKDRHYSFMSIHFFYIIGMSFVGSLIFLAKMNMPYIDALFHATGAATQSGLNTIDVNTFFTYQQIMIYLTAQLCNPITINSAVVVARLISFDKKLKHVTAEQRKNRRRFRGRLDDRDFVDAEKGVTGQSIDVAQLQDLNGGPNQETGAVVIDDHLIDKQRALAEEQTESSDDSKSGDVVETKTNEDHPRQIQFADQIRPSQLADGERLPIIRSKDEHIAVLNMQRQRDAEHKAPLRIAGPRDADAGVGPIAVDEEMATNHGTPRRMSTSDVRLEEDHGNVIDGPSQTTRSVRHAEFEEPPHPHSADFMEDVEASGHILSFLGMRRPTSWKHRFGHHDGLEPSPIVRTGTLQRIKSVLSGDIERENLYLDFQPTIGRNSIFHDLTDDERLKLGGIEYRSLIILLKVLVGYNIGFNLVAMVGLLPWIMTSETYGPIVQNNGQGRVWWGIFTASSAFTDLGFTLTPDSMYSFGTAVWPLLLMSFLIIIGNTGFPIMLRFIIWTLSRVALFMATIVPETAHDVATDNCKWCRRYNELRFLLDHPRRCFTLLFPARATWFLFFVLILLNGIDLLFFIILDLGNSVVTSLAVHVRVLDGWFQAVSTRTAGFAVVSLSALHPAIQVSYLIMMYISVLPIAMSVRNTNVYEEGSLGIYGTEHQDTPGQGETTSYLNQHLRKQLSFDLWFICLGLFIISIAEGPKLQDENMAAQGFTLFNCLFEIVSAYGTVGLSLGFGSTTPSFSSQFTVVSKLVIIAMMIRGRHRGLPYELDRSIILPSEKSMKQEVEMALRARRRSSIGTMDRPNLQQLMATGREFSHPEHGDMFHRRLTHTNSNVHDLAPGRRTRQSSIGSRYQTNTEHSAHPSTGLEAGRSRKIEGRRKFYQEGVNPAPKGEDKTE